MPPTTPTALYERERINSICSFARASAPVFDLELETNSMLNLKIPNMPINIMSIIDTPKITSIRDAPLLNLALYFAVFIFII